MQADLEHTTVDEEAFAVQSAWENGLNHPARKMHVHRQLRSARMRLGLEDLDAKATAACQGVIDAPEIPERLRALWAGFDPTRVKASPDLQASALAMWEPSEHPVARVLKGAWKTPEPLALPSPSIKAVTP